ncbi:MAG: DUF2868 domain-containing protein [Verrucomicrobiota bacterium]
MKRWLEKQGPIGLGARWVAAIGLAGSLLMLAFFAIGAVTAWGTLDRSVGGVHVVWFLMVALVLPWLLLLVGVLLWLLRGRIAAGGLFQSLMERLSLRFAGRKARRAIEQAKAVGELSGIVGWRLARWSQLAAAAFHGGALAGLGAMVLFKRVGFFWETTTERAMEGFLTTTVAVLSAPWSWAAPQLVPDVAASESIQDWKTGGLGWWPFLILSLLIWGLLPRLLLAGWAGWSERRALGRLTFQSPHHRKLWRAMTGVKRGEEPVGPVDGALVVSLEGAVPAKESLRPFMLRVLRMNPTGWERLGVLDQDHEEAARAALEKATAGIVLLAEGWSLAPRSVEKALDEVASRAGDRRVVLLVGNPTADGSMGPPEAEQRVEWERFMDGRRGDEVELVFCEET